MGQAVAGAWHHVAISRVSGTTSGYLNGTRVFNLSDSKNYPADHLTVADYGDPSAGPYYGGPMYVSNLRIIKGSGIYSGTSITVPTSKLTNVTNTSF